MLEPSSPEDGVDPEDKKPEGVGDTEDQQEEPRDLEEQEYEIERILDEWRSKENGVLYYKIRWLGYSPKYDSFEPASEIEKCTEIVAEWEKKKAERLLRKGTMISSACRTYVVKGENGPVQ
jgi:hypothetical protein